MLQFAFPLLLHLDLRESLLLVHDLVAHFVFSFVFELVVPDLLLILRTHYSSLLSLFLLAHLNGVLDFTFLIGSLLLDHVVLRRVIPVHF